MGLALLVSLAAGLGAVCRYLLDQAVQGRTSGRLPYGTFLVNVTGSFALGLLLGLSAHHGLGSGTTTVLGSGFAGGYTTLSTWAWETLALAEAGEVRGAWLNAIGSFAAGLVAAAAGFGLALL